MKVLVLLFIPILWPVVLKEVRNDLLDNDVSEFTGPAFSPDGDYLLFAANPRGQYDLYTLQIITGEIDRLTFHAADDWYGEWISEETIIFHSKRNDQTSLYSLDLSSKEEKPVLKENVNQLLHYNLRNGCIYYTTYESYVAPDGNSYPKMQTAEIVRYKLENGDKKYLTQNNYSDDASHISPDGKTLVFQSEKSGNMDIYKMNTDGSNLIQLTFDKSFEGIPIWSPDGQYLAYTKRIENLNYDIWIMDKDGKHQMNLTNHPDMDLYAAWTPDGKYIAFSSWRDGSQQIYLMGRDGSNQHCVTCTLKLP